MKYFFLLFLLFSVPLFSQTRSLQLTSDKGKIVVVNDKKRVKIVTQDGESYFGRIKFLDDEHIVLRKDTIAIADVAKIQKRPLAKAIASSVLIPISAVAVPLGVAIALSDSATAGVLMGSGVIGIPTGILLPVLGKTYTKKHWAFAIKSE